MFKISSQNYFIANLKNRSRLYGMVKFVSLLRQSVYSQLKELTFDILLNTEAILRVSTMISYQIRHIHHGCRCDPLTSMDATLNVNNPFAISSRTYLRITMKVNTFVLRWTTLSFKRQKCYFLLFTSDSKIHVHRKHQSESVCKTESFDSFFVREMTHWD